MGQQSMNIGSTGMDRRDLLRRGAFVVGAAALWTTPVVHTLGARPAAAATPTECVEQPTTLSWRYEPGAAASSGTGNNPAHFTESADLTGCADTAIITVWGGPNGTYISDGPDYEDIAVAPGGTFWVTNMHNGKVGPENQYRIETVNCGVQEMNFHTSCSQDLFIGARYGSLVLIGIQN